MYEVGRLCVKLAGRDAAKKCVIVEILENDHVLIDGQTRRRKCNIRHLEPLEQTIEIKKGASHADVSKAFEKLGFTAWNTKPKKTADKPNKKIEQKEKPVKEKKKTVQKKSKKEEPKKAEKKVSEEKKTDKKE